MCARALLKSEVKSAARGPGVSGMGGCGGGEGEAGAAEAEMGWGDIFLDGGGIGWWRGWGGWRGSGGGGKRNFGLRGIDGW